ncbi:hypothetical protein E1193_06830 [Micromonospora sp. KC606]|uniref:DUF3592 domain-containing protein n=1 Tax=Micromonospora sp. KC606 TaxID=2530379 RepID=UPI001051B01C|nr:DUF3592 domain-containing protein [Micromonospora sp. KC606]TDC84110.1 hypothetical protein E1193_06830 [Micromonospora sp. KC606]
MRPRRVTRTSVVCGALLTVAVTTFVWIGAVGAYRKAVDLRDHGLVTTADVREVHRLGDDSYVRVRFDTTDGTGVETDVYDFRADPEPVEGGTMRVRYAPADPVHHVQDARLGPDFLDVWLRALGGAALLAFGTVLVVASWGLVGDE